MTIIAFLFLVLLQMLTDDYLPTELNVFVDTGGDAHGDDGVIPGTDKHEGQAQTHAQERQSPAGDGTTRVVNFCSRQPVMTTASRQKLLENRLQLLQI